MSAVDTVEGLLKLGVAVKAAFTSAQGKDGSMDWNKFITSADFQAIQGDVNGLVQNMAKTDLDAAVLAIRQKETALLNGQPVAQLPTDKLLQYSDLIHTESILVNRSVESITATSQALSWVADSLLPVLVSVAKVVIPILL